jgi:hypothetical protein
MKSALIVMAFLVALVIGIPVMVLLRDAFGPVAVLGIATACSVAAAWLGHTPASTAYAEDFCGALRDIGMSRKEAAGTMELTEAQLANQINGREMLSAYRVASLGPAFTAALAKRQLARTGSYTVVEEGTLALMLGELRSLLGVRKQVA